MFSLFDPKTAYEMRISDWSSDVCSSDLLSWPSSDSPGVVPVDPLTSPWPGTILDIFLNAKKGRSKRPGPSKASRIDVPAIRSASRRPRPPDDDRYRR